MVILAQPPFLFQGLNDFGLSNVAMKAACKVPQRLADRDVSLEAAKREIGVPPSLLRRSYGLTRALILESFNPSTLQSFNPSTVYSLLILYYTLVFILLFSFCITFVGCMSRYDE